MKRILATAAALFCLAASLFGITPPTDLRCEFQEGDVLVDTPHPRFSWKHQEGQSAYQIVIMHVLGSDNHNMKIFPDYYWNSGKVYSEESNLITYNGPELMSMQNYLWAVRIWDKNGKVSKLSEYSRITTGMLRQDDWKAQWIGAPWQRDVRGNFYPCAPMFRKEFTVKKGLVNATAFISGLGWFEMSLNGRKVGDDYFVPGFTDYTFRPELSNNGHLPLSPEVTFHRTLYLSYDITSQLHKGTNAVGVILGNGYFHADPDNRKGETFGVPRLICQIALTYKDGHTEVLCTDTSWKAAESPIVYNNLYGGEIYDATREMAGWDKPGFNDAAWSNSVVRKAPDGKLSANMGPTDKVTKTLSPVKFEKQADGSFKVDFGEQISGWIRFSGIKGEPGARMKVEYLSESQNGKCEYIFKDREAVSYAPRFDWFNFREAIISGISSLSPSDIVAEAVNSDVPVNSTFDCSNPLFVKINDIFRRSQMNNMHSGVASDCPHRERLPYTGDGQIAMNTVLSNFDASSFYNKWLEDIRGSQNPVTGHVPNGAPWEPYCGGGPAWGAAICIMPLEFYLAYGDRSVLERNLESMKQYVSWFGGWKRDDGTILVEMKRPGEDKPYKWYNLGDWAPSFETPDPALVHTFYYWLCASNVSKVAGILGQRDAQFQYAMLCDEIEEAFHKVFYDEDQESYGDYGSNVYALYMGVPGDRYREVKATLRRELKFNYKNHLNTGMLATRFLFEVLSQNGLGDIAYDIMNQRDFPSYGWWIEQGATTTWEHWNGKASHDHPMMGGGLTWFYKILAGVDTDPLKPGFRHVIIRPIPVNALKRVSYSTQTPYGKVSSTVTHDGANVHITAEIPEGATATIYVPRNLAAASSNPMDESSYVTHEVGSGTWTF